MTANNVLVDGMDSGAVPEPIKREIYIQQRGICSEPDCDELVDRQYTRVGDCAHIIPKIVGSHPREDYITPLDDRKKEPNLLYLCKKHHFIVDNPEHAEKYTAELLRDWKRRHKEWAAGITKKNNYLPKKITDNVNAVLESFNTKLSDEIKISSSIINHLIDSCRELVYRRLLSDANLLLSHIELLLLDIDSKPYELKFDVLKALFLLGTENIPEAKSLLLKAIQEHPGEIDPLIEYFEICKSYPEPDDHNVEIEAYIREYDPDNKRLLLYEYGVQLEQKNIPDVDSIPDNSSDDIRVNCRFLIQKSLFYQELGEFEKRDRCLDMWEEYLPTSARVNLFRVIYKNADSSRLGMQKNVVNDARKFSIEQNKIIQEKDPLSLNDLISWSFQDLQTELLYSKITGGDSKVIQIRDDIITYLSNCYFGKHIYINLPEILSRVRLEEEQLNIILGKISKSEVVPTTNAVELVFLQGIQFNGILENLKEFISKYGNDSLVNILNGIIEQDEKTVANLVNDKNDAFFSSVLIESIPNVSFRLKLLDLITFSEDVEEATYLLKLEAHDHQNNMEEVDQLLRAYDLKNPSPQALSVIEKIAYKRKKWDIFITTVEELLKYDLPLPYSIELYAKLAYSYSNQGDDSNCIKYSEKALENHSELVNGNAQSLLHLLVGAYLIKSDPDSACKSFEKHKDIERTLPLSIEEAQAYLSSNRENKEDIALSLIVEAFKKVTVYEERMFLAPLMILTELANLGKIEIENEKEIESGCYIKIEGFDDVWFYMGEEKDNIGAHVIDISNPNYNALIGKTLGEEIEWDSDKYSGQNKSRKIQNICKTPLYLYQRAHEAMANVAKMGNAPIWSVNVIKEDGSLNIENLERFGKDQFASSTEFFETYISERLPFAFLCKMEGGITKALGKIAAEQKGFIYLNDSQISTLTRHQSLALSALENKTCVIDGLSTLMLIESELLEAVISNIPNIIVSTSTIRLIREIAKDFGESSKSVGSAGFIDGKFRYQETDRDKNIKTMNKLLKTAGYLDKLPNKAIGYTYDSSERTLDTFYPSYYSDAFNLAVDNNTVLLTDDYLFVEAYKTENKENIPNTFSSYSLIKVLAENKIIEWEDYLRHYSLLSYYRFHLLPVSVDEIGSCIFPPTKGNIVDCKPKNIFSLNLQLTLSEEYGVKDDLFVSILSQLFMKVILDETITPEIADEIFAICLIDAIGKKDKRLTVIAIYQVCMNYMKNEPVTTELMSKKYDCLKRQIKRYAQEYSPITLDTSIILKP